MFSPAGEQLAVPCQAGQRLSEAIWLSGQVEPVPLCGGLGQCGRCACRFLADAPLPADEDRQYFSEARLKAGWRLACRHFAPSQQSLCLELPELKPAAKRQVLEYSGNQPVALGIDLGTTSVQWRAVAPERPDSIAACGEFINPQAGAGADVISRLAFAMLPEGMARLSHLARKGIASILAELADRGLAVERACIAANSAMTEILLERDISGLAAAPYQLAGHGNETLELALPGIGRTLPVYIPPLPAPFVGGDTSAGLLTLLDKPRPLILADLGTNAELALLDDQDNLFLASAPLGPAMEGIGPSCGQPAGPGVITGFVLGPDGLMPQYYDNTRPAIGISASGYLSLLANLLNCGILDPAGYFNDAPRTPLAAKITHELHSGRLGLGDGMCLTQADSEMLLKVRAALAVAFQRILVASRLTTGEIAGIWLAGALGEHCNVDDLALLGLLPDSLALKTHACGNTSLAGACILAAQPERGQALAELCAKAKILQMADDPAFMTDYMAAMKWGSYAA